MGGQGGQLPNLVFADRFYLNKRGQIVPPTSLLAQVVFYVPKIKKYSATRKLRNSVDLAVYKKNRPFFMRR